MVRDGHYISILTRTRDKYLKVINSFNTWKMSALDYGQYLQIGDQKYLKSYIIHGNLQWQWFLGVFALMQRKIRFSYYEVLFNILEAKLSERVRRELNPLYISVDYELPVMNVVTVALPRTQLPDCLFHVGQEFWRRLQSEGLRKQYQDNGEKASQHA